MKRSRAAPSASYPFALLLACLAAAASAAAPAQRSAQNRGLWIGPIPACAGTVASVAAGPDEAGFPSAALTFRPGWRAALLRETRGRVGRRILVRLDGRTLTAPVVREPISGGVISLSGPTARQIERIRAAASRPCPRGRR